MPRCGIDHVVPESVDDFGDQPTQRLLILDHQHVGAGQLVGLHDLGLRFLESPQVVMELGVNTDLVERDREVMGEARENASVLIGEAAGRLIAGDQQTDRSLLTANPRHDHRANAPGRRDNPRRRRVGPA